MAKRKIKEAVEAVETKVEQIVEDVKEEATEDVTTFTIDRWHVLVAAIVVTVTALVVIL
jgi:hypothetical protein